MPELCPPDVRFHRSFLAAVDEFVEDGSVLESIGLDLDEYGDTWGTPSGFARYAEVLCSTEHTPRREGFVTDTTLWWVDGAEFIGRISIRHELTEFLRTVGGHIGYAVRPSQRGKGHATALLAAALPVAAAHGVDPALITCDTTNAASRRVIEANGGVLLDELDAKLRYWVPSRPPLR